MNLFSRKPGGSIRLTWIFLVKTYIGDIYYFTTGKNGCEDGANVGGLEG